MKTRSRILATLILLGTSPMTPTSVVDAATIRIALIGLDANEPAHAVLHAGAADRAAAINRKSADHLILADITGRRWDSADQKRSFLALLSTNIDAALLVPHDAEVSAEIEQLAHEAAVSLLSIKPNGDTSGHLSIPWTREGREAVRELRRMRAAGGGILLVSGNPATPGSTIRTEAVLAAVGDQTDDVMLVRGAAEVGSVLDAMQSVVTADRDQRIHGWIILDPRLLALPQDLKRLNPRDLPVVAVATGPTSVLAVERDTVDTVISADWERIGEIGVQRLYNLENRRSAPETENLERPVHRITADNVKEWSDHWRILLSR